MTSSTADTSVSAPPTDPAVRPRIVVAKCGLDAHERGVHTVSRGLRDYGFEVIYLGLRQTPESICAVAQQEDVDVIGISSLAGGHRKFLSKLGDLMKEHGMDDVLLVVGGVIPDEDLPFLRDHGVAAVFGQGTTVADIASWIRSNIRS